MPLMPVGIAEKDDEVAVISHGENMLYVANLDGEILWQQKVGANPFATAYFADYIVVAGYDDQNIYFLNEHEIVKEVQTDKGPFQLFVREGYGMTTILIIDDELDMRNLIEVMLLKSNFRTLTAENGQQAYEILTNEEVDLILLDVMMPEEDGFQVCTKISLYVRCSNYFFNST